MKETEFLGKLLPGHPDIFPIIQNIREKYGIPPINPEDDPTEILLTRDDIDWEAVKQDIETQVRTIQFFDDNREAFLQGLRKIQETPFDFPELAPLSDETRQGLIKLIATLMQPYFVMLSVIDEKTVRPTTEAIYEYLITGKTREAPEEWFGKVFSGNMFGDKIVIAMAGEGTNPKVIAEQLKREIKETFGEYKFDITNAHLATAEYLAMQLQGDSLKRLVERYEEKHPSEFPQDKASKEYKETVQRHIEMMKKRIQRVKDFLKAI